MGEKQSRQHGFADAGVGTGDKDYVLQTSASLAVEFETDETNESLPAVGEQGIYLFGDVFA
jgi:hypothetical protein